MFLIVFSIYDCILFILFLMMVIMLNTCIDIIHSFFRPQTMRLLLEGDSPAVRGQEQSKTFRRRSANLNIQKCIL